VYSIEDGTVLAGNLPPQKHKLVVAWIEIHKEDLMADWELAVNGQNPLPIRGLDPGSMKIAKVTSREDGTLHIIAEDGRFGTFDVRPYLESAGFLPLKDWAEFSQVRSGGYYIEWRCGADLSADTIEARWQEGAASDAQ